MNCKQQFGNASPLQDAYAQSDELPTRRRRRRANAFHVEEDLEDSIDVGFCS